MPESEFRRHAVDAFTDPTLAMTPQSLRSQRPSTWRRSRVEVLRVVPEPLLLRQGLVVEHALPVVVLVAGRADTNLASLAPRGHRSTLPSGLTPPSTLYWAPRSTSRPLTNL